jgi:hypothetical protein
MLQIGHIGAQSDLLPARKYGGAGSKDDNYEALPRRMIVCAMVAVRPGQEKGASL